MNNNQALPLTSILIFSIIGAIVSTLCDGNHVFTETLSYTYPYYFGQAWWVFPNFLVAFIVMSLGYYLTPVFLPESIDYSLSTSSGKLSEFLDTTVIYILVYLMTGFAHHNPWLLAFILYGLFFVRLYASYERSFVFIVAILLAIGGNCVESTLALFGQMQYTNPNLYYVPIWLGSIYMHASFCLRASLRYFVYGNEESYD